jgi:hypothetical protein
MGPRLNLRKSRGTRVVDGNEVVSRGSKLSGEEGFPRLSWEEPARRSPPPGNRCVGGRSSPPRTILHPLASRVVRPMVGHEMKDAQRRDAFSPPTVASRGPPGCPFHPRRENLLASGPTTSVLRILGSRPTSRRTFRRPAAKAKRRRVTGNDSIHAAPQTALDPELSLGCRRTPPSFESTGVPFLGLTSGGFGPAFSRSAARGESRGSSPSGPEFSNPRRQKVRVPIHINTY